MLIPNKFKLGAVDWNVKVIPEMHELQGNCDPRSGIIRVEKNSNRSVQEQTFCHELVHSFLFNAGINEHDEVLVDKLGYSLHQYLVEVYGKE